MLIKMMYNRQRRTHCRPIVSSVSTKHRHHSTLIGIRCDKKICCWRRCMVPVQFTSLSSSCIILRIPTVRSTFHTYSSSLAVSLRTSIHWYSVNVPGRVAKGRFRLCC